MFCICFMLQTCLSITSRLSTHCRNVTAAQRQRGQGEAEREREREGVGERKKEAGRQSGMFLFSLGADGQAPAWFDQTVPSISMLILWWSITSSLSILPLTVSLFLPLSYTHALHIPISWIYLCPFPSSLPLSPALPFPNIFLSLSFPCRLPRHLWSESQLLLCWILQFN